MIGTLAGVRAEHYGGHLLEDALAGDTVLVLDAVFDYDEDGGSVEIDATVYEFTEIDPDAETLTLATPLAADSEAGTPVWSLDAEGNREVEWIADLDLGEDGDIVPAEIPTALIDAFPEGDAAAGQRVEVEPHGDGFRVLGRPGQNQGVTSKRYRANNSLIPNATWTNLPFGTLTADPDRRINYGSGLWTCTVPGEYLFVTRAQFDSNVVGTRRIALYINGVPVANANRTDSESIPILQLIAQEGLQVGDTAGFYVFQNSGGDLNVTGGANVTNARITKVAD